MKHIHSIIMSLVTSMIVLTPSNVALAQPTDGDGGTTGGGVTGGDGATVGSPITIDGDFSDWAALEQSLPNACVSVSTDDNALYTGLYKAQFFVNGDSLFFYIEYSNSKQVQEAGTNYFTDMIHIMLQRLLPSVRDFLLKKLSFLSTRDGLMQEVSSTGHNPSLL